MKVWTKEEIKGLIENRDDAVIRGMKRIYELQTEDEKENGGTYYNNGVGFSGVDGDIMSSFVKFYNKTNFLTAKQMKIARKKMLKYAGQLTNLVNKKI
tara:strand:- start:277 stop:570 length:294 start_codon:yes stop_codon:yes gene_type:complete